MCLINGFIVCLMVLAHEPACGIMLKLLPWLVELARGDLGKRTRNFGSTIDQPLHPNTPSKTGTALALHVKSREQVTQPLRSCGSFCAARE